METGANAAARRCAALKNAARVFNPPRSVSIARAQMTQMKDCEVMSGIISQLASYFVIPGFSSRAGGETEGTEGRGQGRDAGVEICQAALGGRRRVPVRQSRPLSADIFIPLSRNDAMTVEGCCCLLDAAPCWRGGENVPVGDAIPAGGFRKFPPRANDSVPHIPTCGKHSARNESSGIPTLSDFCFSAFSAWERHRSGVQHPEA